MLRHYRKKGIKAQEEQESVRADRAALVRLYHDEMVDLLKLMGMTVPDRM